MKKIVYLLVVIALIGSLTVLTANAQREENYAVGGEILPVSSLTFLFSPWVLALVAIILLAAGGAIYTGAITIEIVK